MSLRLRTWKPANGWGEEELIALGKESVGKGAGRRDDATRLRAGLGSAGRRALGGSAVWPVGFCSSAPPR